MEPVIDNLDLYWEGFLRSLGIIGWSLVGSLLLGTLIAAFRVSPVASLRAFGSAWVTVVRNCPLTIVLFFMAFGLPELGINTSFYVFGVTGLIIFTQTLTQVVLPQALRATVPPLGSVQIAMFKNSAVVGAFGVGGDLWSAGRNLTSAQGYSYIPVLTGVAIGYLVITLTGGALLAVIERKVAIAR